MTVTVIGWWMYLLTESKLALGLVGLSEVIPAVSLALYAGHRIDISEKKSLLLKAVIAYGVCILLLAWLSGDIAASMMDNWTIAFFICMVIALTGIIRAFAAPGFGAMISQIVPREYLPSAAGMSSAAWLTASIIGHALGGFLIAWIGIHQSFWVILFFVAAGFALLTLLKPKPAVASAGINTWKSVKEGLDHVFKTKELLGALMLDLFAVLFGGAVALIPVFAKDILKTGPMGFGWLNAASDIGAILIVAILTLRPLRGRQGKILLLSVAGFGACIIVFALSRFYWLSFLALLVSGLLDGISVVIRGTILQLKTPDHLRGRVMSVNSMFISSSNELGQFESGLMAKLIGTVPSVIFGGIMTIGIVATTWFKAPSLRRMRY
jgi:MFS family permease